VRVGKLFNLDGAHINSSPSKVRPLCERLPTATVRVRGVIGSQAQSPCLPSGYRLCRRSSAHKATASALLRAQGSRTFLPRSRARARQETSRPDLALRGPDAGQISIA
jgi:hypothetical protein